MKKAFIFSFVFCFETAFPQSIEETLDQIHTLKEEISQNEKLVEEKISDLKETNPLFADQDVFESDIDYLARMSKAMPQISRLRKQYLEDLWKKMSILRGRMFETIDITVVLEKDLYDANKEVWPVTVNHHGYQRESLSVKMSIPKKNAATLYKNWPKVQKTGILTIDVGDKIGLAKFNLKDPISGYEFTHEFVPMRTFGTQKYIYSAVFSPDGKYLATGNYRIANIFNLETGEKVQDLPKLGNNVNSVAFSPDGKYLAIGDSRYNAKIFLLGTGGEVQNFPNLGEYVRSVAFSPDGKYLAIGDSRYNAKIFNLETGAEVRSFNIGFNVNSVAFSPDGKYLATGARYRAQLFNLETGAEVRSFKNRNSVNSVAFSPDGTYLATGSSDNYAHLFHLETGTESSIKHSSVVKSVAFSPDGTYLATGEYENFAHIFNLKTGEKVRSFKHDSNVKSVAFSPDGKYLATTSVGAQLFRTMFQVEEDVLATKSISRPPSLSAKISFSESSGNQFLDAMETGNIALTIANRGQGPGKGILVKITPERTDNLNYNNTYIEEIPPGKSISVDIPVETYIALRDGDHTFRFDFEEVNGFPPDPVELQFSTKAYLNPEMYIVDVGIEDDNMNGKIESGEMINVTVRIGNKGKGTAMSSYAKFYGGANVFITDTHSKTVKMGELAYNGSIDIPLEFFVNDKTVDEIPLYVDLTEENSLANVSKLRVPIKKSERVRQIGRTVVSGIEQEYKKLTLGADLSIDIEQNIPETKKRNKDAVAIVIGNKNYTNADVPEVTFAHRDAAVMEQYLTKMMGYPDVIVETDATQGKFFALFGTDKKNGKLQDYVRTGQSDVFIYYSGHGAPDPESKDGYFVPTDCDPSMVDVNGYSLALFYEKINSLGAKSVTVVIDACFSGSSDQGMLLKNISPVGIRVHDASQMADNIAVFTSSSGEQVSSWYPEMKHSLYTYFFLKGLRGSADVNKDQSITAQEMQFYVHEEVKFMARKLNSREQTPGLNTPDEERVIISY